MAIAKAAVLQHLPFRQKFVDLVGHLRTRGTGAQQAHAVVVGGYIDFPNMQAGGINFTDKHRAFQRGVIARDHRKGVEAEDIAALQLAAGDRVVGTIGVQPRLEPHPGVAVFGIRKPPGNLQFHRIAARHRHVNFARPDLDRVADRVAADIGHIGPGADQTDLCRRFVHPLPHGGRGNIHPARRLQKGVQLFRPFQRQMVGFTANHLGSAGDRRNRPPEIVAFPIGVGDGVTMAAPPRLARIDPGADRDAGGGRHHHRIGAAKRAIEKAGIIGDIVHRGQHSGINSGIRHDGAQTGQPGLVFLGGKRQRHLFPIVKPVEFWAVNGCGG